MRLVLARIDDRLIHGQVTAGWGQKLRPDRIVLVSEEIAADPWQATVYASAVPPSMQVSILGVADAAAQLTGDGPLAGARRVILLTASPDDMLALVMRGVPVQRINVGGLHQAAGKRELVPSVYVRPGDLAVFRDLLRRGISVSVQAVPGAREIELDEALLDAAERRW